MTHLIPVNDTQEHTLSARCACRPETDGRLVSHNSFDNREELEEIAGRAAEGKHWTLIEEPES